MIKTVIKRDGRSKLYNEDFVRIAIHNAYLEVSTEDKFKEDYIFLYPMIENKFNELNKDEITVEEIQDIVIGCLFKIDSNVARAYENYRKERTLEREKRGDLDKEINNIMQNCSEESTANANVDGSKIQAIKALISNVVTRDYSRRHYIPKKFRKKQRKELYVHDEYYFGLPFWNCNNTNWQDMFKQGFQLGSTKIESPKSLESAINILTQVASHIASNTYGGVTFGNLVTGLTPYAKRSLNKYRKEAKDSTWCKNDANEIETYAWEQLDKEAKNTAQSLEYEVQTLMTSRAETPFLTIGLDCIDLNADEETQKIQIIITKAILNQRIKGLTDGVTPVFPKIVYHLEKGNNLLPTDPYHDLYILAIKCSSLRGYPDYVMNEKTKEITGSIKPPMGCVDGQEIITYKINNDLFVESFERMWNRLSNKFKIKEQKTKDNYYMDLKDVLIYDTKNGFVDTKRIIKNKDKGDWTRIKFSNGRSLLATSDHPLPIINQGRTFVKDLKIGDKININQSQYSEESIMYNTDKAWLLGFLLCDGCYDDQISSSIALIGEDDIETNYKKIFKELYNLDVKTIVWNRGKRGDYKELKIGTEKYEDYKKVQSELLETFGGKQKIYRQIPNEVFSWNKESKLSFLAGMIDADGYINSTGHCGSIIQIGSTNKELALQTMALSQSLGLPTKVYLNHYTSKDKNKLRYRVEFTATMELLKYMSCHKKIDCFTREANITLTNEATVTSIEFLGNINNFSYDVTTESDYFEVSGIYSHNCRSFLPLYYDKNGNEQNCGRFNWGVYSINFVRLAIKANHDINKFFEYLEEELNDIRQLVKIKYDILKKVKAKQSPILYMSGAIARLNAEDTIEPLLLNSYSTVSIGYVGLHNALVALYGKGIDSHDNDIFNHGEEIMNYVRTWCEKTKQETHIHYSMYGTPAETLATKFCEEDVKDFGLIEGVNTNGYYENSFHYPSNTEVSPFEKLDIESRFNHYSSGGLISFVELGDMTKNLEALESIITYAYDKTPFLGISTISDRCLKCGYVGEIYNIENDDFDFKCPHCGNTDKSLLSVIRKLCGYLGSLTERPTIYGKMKEIHNRINNKGCN